jgi:hypothetical protein
MNDKELEALYMTTAEVAELLDVGERRVFALVNQGQFTKLKGGVYNRASVEAYKAKRGNKKGGRYPKE